MTYKGTDKIMYIVNKQGKNERASAHVSFDEAHMSSPTKSQPPMSTMLQQAGYRPLYLCLLINLGYCN